ncbi:DUF4167 domain-containing protein [Tabrizicola sp. J26]|uniref:DUF4167 domain-containing protein n=1 Tax=Alitabrizicola rongguiensis TaxID=2909234 RepID=UPI001F2A3C0D|nr:DUF4167 domain-containing protein [Tabrizicola rongguiensis]MCF1709972.1 DUF4167 domain-containing protein [Tabrizicola rongguiensis]
MRSSKSRSRSKSNRPRSIGNIINRVFDSNGPEGKVRGTPQQIIEKYQILARDAQLSNDRVAAENFMQHAEHYTRLLAEAQRELAAEQEARQQQGGHNQQGGNGQGGNGQGGNRERNWQNDRNDTRGETRYDPVADEQPDMEPAPRIGGMMDFIEDLGESSLVETPETRSREHQQRQDRSDRPEQRDRQDPRERGPRNDQPRNDQQGRSDRNDRRPPRHEQQRTEQPRAEAVSAPAPEPAAVEVVAEAPAAPVAEKPPAARKPRAPRKPKAESGPAEAAE